MAQGKMIGNVNLLDLRKATPESVAEVRGIGNVNLILYTSETARLVTRINIGNMNSSVEVPVDVKVDLVSGQTIYKKESFDLAVPPSFAVIVGQGIFDPGVTAEMVAKGFSGIALAGQLIVPEPLIGAVQSQIRQKAGQIKTYPPLAQTRIGHVDLDEGWLKSLADGSEICVLGKLKLDQVVSNDLLARKIKRLYVLEGISCHEENADALRNCLVEGSGAINSIPAGFAVIEKPLRLDAMLLEALPTRKLLCKEMVHIDGDVTAGLLDERLEALHSEEFVLCPSALRSVLLKKCDPLKDQLIFFEGLLCLIKDADILRASFFENLDGPVTLVVTGDLTIDAAIEPAMLAARLAKVHNQGVIHCTPQQMGVIRARLGFQDGVLLDSTLPEEPEKETDDDFIGNANYLAL